MIIQSIIDIAEVCSRHNISQAVIAPGSRSAALTLAFARHPNIKTYVIPDERSAGYVALGLAQSSRHTVAVICTSGTAAANLYPSIIEAYYQEVPLLVLTADRPPEWIDQQDGQTVRQEKLYHNHILGSYQFPVSLDHKDAIWHAHRIINEAILKTKGFVSGPVHINVPIREPFYPTDEEEFNFSSEIKIIDQVYTDSSLNEDQVFAFVKEISSFEKVLILVGQGHWSEEFLKLLAGFQERFSWTVIGDIISNIHPLTSAIDKHDLILMDREIQKDLAPEIIISIGQSILSKGLKGFLRRFKPKAHWHIGSNPEIKDTFQSLTKIIKVQPEIFFIALNHVAVVENRSIEFSEKWNRFQIKTKSEFENFMDQIQEGEFAAVKKVLEFLPAKCDLHLANSMPVRYASYIGLKSKNDVRVWSNRGTSGIDGCLSTVIGHALNKDRLQVLVIGDLAFFYDRNALWHPHVPENLRIILLNNHGGGIFRLIDGPRQQPELAEYFETKQTLNAENTAKDFNLAYFSMNDLSDLSKVLSEFFLKETGKAILEIETEPKMNEEIFMAFKNHFNK
jgi:2-succinyl-5-enolpyruvyl-6-hydroxy-3-cyclohexene-1-carboxylate synthase